MSEPPQENDRLGSVTPRIGTRQHFRWLRGIALAMILLNVLDAGLTTLWISWGVAEEANPFLAHIAHNHPVRFVVVKFCLVALGVLLLWRNRKRKSAVVAIFGCFLVYYFILLYHLRSMNLRLFETFWG